MFPAVNKVFSFISLFTVCLTQPSKGLSYDNKSIKGNFVGNFFCKFFLERPHRVSIPLKVIDQCVLVLYYMIYSLQGKLLYHLQCLNEGATLQSVPLQQNYTTLDMMSRCEDLSCSLKISLFRLKSTFAFSLYLNSIQVGNIGYYWLAKWDLDECELSNWASLPKVMLAVMIMRMLFLANNSLSMMMIGDDDCLPANMLI